MKQQLRQMSGDHHHMIVQPSRFQWNKFKDLLHFYVMLGVIPITAVVMYCNIFIGPAQLHEIPEGYEPKYWEYHRVSDCLSGSTRILYSPKISKDSQLFHLIRKWFIVLRQFRSNWNCKIRNRILNVLMNRITIPLRRSIET